MKAILIALGILFIVSSANADVFLVIDKKSKDVISISNEQDCVLQDGWTEIVLQGNLEDYKFQYRPTYYKYKNERFIPDIKRLSDEALQQEEAKAKAEEEVLIRKEMRKIAIERLKEEGITFKHIEE